MTETRIEALLVASDPIAIAAVRNALVSCVSPRIDLRVARGVTEAAQAMRAGRVDVTLLDLHSLDPSSSDVRPAVCSLAAEAPTLAIADVDDEEVALQLLREGVDDYLPKADVSGPRLSKAIRCAIERASVIGARHRSLSRYRALIENAAYGIYQSSPSGRVPLCNPAFARMLGYRGPAELAGLVIASVYCDPHERVKLTQRYESCEKVTGETVRWRRHDDEIITVRLSGQPIKDADDRLLYWDMIAEDVTEKSRLEAQFLQAQKMECVGRLAGGVAHDFNNILTVVMAECELSLDELTDADAPVQRSLTEIRMAARRAAALTRQLLAFSRVRPIDPTVFDIGDLLVGMETMLRRVLGADIELVTRTGTGLRCVRADRGQVEQILMNLVINARDAMPEGGTLTVEALDTDCPDEATVTLAVTDTGVGMSDEVRARIFEPFFTTKDAGTGTGLGLATCQAIAEEAGGYLSVQSAVGRGTKIMLHLPRVRRIRPCDPDGQAAPPPRGSETILLVEDDPHVRPLTARVLNGLGYRVLTAGTAIEAIEVVGHGAIDLMLTDVILPDETGRRLAERAVESCSDIRVMFMSGYTEDAALTDQVRADAVVMLLKPFTKHELAHAIRTALDA